MNNLISYPSKNFNSNLNSNEKASLDKDENIIPRYRNIPVLKTFDNIQSPGRYYENVSCVKEVVKTSYDEKSNFFDDGSESKISRTSNKKRTKPDSVVHFNPLQFKHPSSLSFFERMGHGSVSEPALCNAKDRGDSITLQDIRAENEFISNKYNNAAKFGLSKHQGIKGRIYVKSGGKLFKSIIETEALQLEDDARCSLQGMENGNDVQMHLGDSPDKNRFFRLASKGKKNLKQESDGEFEIAIFLSGIKNVSEKNPRKQKVLVSRKKKSESRFKQDKKMKKKKRKNEAAFVFGKQFATLQESYQDSLNLLTVSHYDSGRNFRGEKKHPPRWLPDISSESGSEYGIENKIKEKTRRPKKFFEDTSTIDNRDQNRKQSHAWGKKYDTIDRSKVISVTNLCEFSDEYKMPKSKIRDHVLWAKFESIFRMYASTTLHSGEVIPRKISTEWMTRAGVVDEILTESEADKAFRQAAGVKITMNAQEYKEFLIMLTLRMKLPYYEIYRRMCGI